MGVQYHGTAVASTNAHFSNTSATSRMSQRAPDLILKPCQEGLAFTLQLIAANRMAKVVELQLQQQDQGKAKHELSDDDVDDLFCAMGSQKHDSDNNDNDDDDDEEEEEKVMDEYQPPDYHGKLQARGGLVYLESLSIVGDTQLEQQQQKPPQQQQGPSLIVAITSFLTSTTAFPRFSSLSLQGVNLQGSVLELRAMAEALRLHPRLRRVQMTTCWFTPEQQDDMDSLQAVFREQDQQNKAMLVFSNHQNGQTPHNLRDMVEPKYGPPTTTSAAATNANGLYNTQDLYAVDPSNKNTNNNNNTDTNNNSTMGWGERLFKSCFCWW